LHTGPLPAFEAYRIVEQIHKALDRKVWLPSGGYLIIERTEAMTIVDVNTGKSVGKTNLEATVVNTNLEAAREVARQLRLRDIGGIIVIDFIDMLLEKNKKQVEDTMRDALAIDKTRSQVFEIGPLGLMQVTRKRVSSGLVESFSQICPTCEGRGIILTYDVD
jgi:ribonuclease E